MAQQQFKIHRVIALPSDLEPGAVYLVAPEDKPDYVEMYVVNNTGDRAKRIINENDIKAIILAQIDEQVKPITEVQVVDTYADLASIDTTVIYAFVKDATGDSTVKSGGAMYVRSGPSEWTKVSEAESLDVHIADRENPHQVTKEQVGLGNVDNTADVDKPVSNAVNSAIITATTDMATKTYVNSKDGDLTTLTTTDKTNLVEAINEVVSVKADKATTLVGYGISDAYTKSEIDTDFSGIKTLYDKNVQSGAGASGWTSDLVVEGGLTQRQINALNKIYHPSQYGTLTHGTGDDTKALQDCADALPNGATFRFDGVAKLTRAKGYHEDLYGTEGRSIVATPGGVRKEIPLNGGQACLIFREKKDIVIDLRGAELFTETYAQGIIDLYKCENVTIIGGKLTGGAYIRETGEYKWIPLDGTTGRGEKGYTTAGFNTTSLIPDIGTSRNNQFITENQTAGGYGGQFPQFDGTTSTKWGTWRGGQIGTQGYAICVIGGRNIEISHTETHGFNGGSFILGIQRTLDGSKSFARISTTESRKYTPQLVNIHDNYLHDNYAGGCHMERAIQVFFRDNLVMRMGHPNASVADEFVDPGYGFSTSRAMPCFDYDVSNNTFTSCYRKGIDTHQGTGFRFSGNKIWGTKYHGIGIAVDDDFADTYYQPYFDHFAIVENNEITAHACGIFYSNGEFGRARREDAKKRWEQLHVVIDGNVIRSNVGFHFNYGHSPFKIINNTFTYAALFANEKLPTAPFRASGIYIGSLNRGLVSGNIISNNTFTNSKDGNFADSIIVEAANNQTKGMIITQNVFNVTPWHYVKDADSQYAHNDVVYRSGYTASLIYYNSSCLIPEAIIEQNTVINDFLHPITFTGGGTGAIAYPRIDINGRISGVQLLSGGTGYTGTIKATIGNRGRSAGATLTATATDGVITEVAVTNPGRFYNNTYLLNVPRGRTYYDMSVVCNNIAVDMGVNKATGKGSDLIIATSDMSAPVLPFAEDGKIRYVNTLAKSTNNPAQFAVYNGGFNGGAISFWFKVASGQVTSNSKQVNLFSMEGSFDGVNNPVGNGQIELFTDGFTFSSAASTVNNKLYNNEKLAYDTWHHFVISNPGYQSSNIVFGTSTANYATSVTANFAHIMIHRGNTYKTAEISDLYDETKAIFGK